MKRKIYERLLKWKREDASEVALLIDGARRVGKSWIAEEFGRSEYKSYVLIDFNKLSAAVRDIFENDLEDLATFYRKISQYYGVKLYEGETLFIFDEVQEYPRARAAIKYFMANPKYHFLETGSLMSIAKNVSGIVIPSEEEHIKMYPLDFEEFLWATGREHQIAVIREHFETRAPLGPVHRKIMDAFREYLIVGGMPQAVVKWVDTQDLGKVDATKRRILTLYRADIQKHAGKHALKVENVFDEIPSQLQKHEKRFSITALGEDARMREYENAFFWLKDSMIVNMCYNSTEPSVGLSLKMDSSTLKCYMADTGLLVSHAFDANELAREDIHRRILFDSLEIDMGMVTENVVAQMLTAAGHKLFFFSRWSNESADERMEIDFLVANSKVRRSKNVTPIEVKSGKRYTLKSLTKYSEKYKAYLDTPIVLHSKDVEEKDGFLRLPIYMAGCL